MSIVLKASVNVRMRAGGRFPKESVAAVLAPARASLVKDVTRAFDTASNPINGKPWPARKGDYPHPPLVKTGAMRAAAIQAAAGAVINGSTLYATVRSPKYAGLQQRGTRTIRARRFLAASIGTVRIVQAGLARAGRAECLRVVRGGR